MDRLALGRYLRESREARELTLEDVVQASRIRRSVLESFEQGNFDVAESQVQIRGFLRNYAHYLGLDEDRVIQYYAAVQNPPRRRGRRRNKRESQTMPQLPPTDVTDTPPAMQPVTLADQRSEQRQRTSNLLRNVILYGVAAVALFVIGFVALDLSGIREQLFSSDGTRVADATDEPPAGAEDIVRESTPATSTPTPTITPTNAAPETFLGQGIRLVLQSQLRTWVSVYTDDEVRFVGVMPPGNIQEFEAVTGATVTLANAAGVSITFNGSQLPTFGERTQEAVITFEPGSYDVAVSEPVVSEPAMPEPTATPQPAAGPTATHTPLAPEIAGQPTPTPLFGVPQDEVPAFTSTPTPTVEAAQSGGSLLPFVTPEDEPPTDEPAGQEQAAPSPTELPLESPEPTNTPTATLSPTPTLTPTSAAVLPPRETPSDLPPPKGAG